MTKSTITDERLAELVAFKPLPGTDITSATRDEWMAMAAELQERRKADSEPVAWTSEEAIVEVYCDETGMIGPKHMVGDVPLYRHAQPVPEKYNIGDATIRHIFTPTGMTNLSDMQAVFDRVEAVLVGMDQPAPVVPDGLIAAVNRLLDSDGSRGCYSAIRCGNARFEVERLLAAAPQEVPDGK